MKKIIISLCIIVTTLSSIAQTTKPCPVTGDSKRKIDQLSDSLKNRNSTSIIVSSKYIGEFFVSGDDFNRFTYYTYVKVRGMITEVKHGSSEQCNCHSTEKLDYDIHIVFSDSLGNGKMICEVNRFTQATDKGLNYAAIHSMIGRQVIIYGWLFPDSEHEQNATNTCIKCTNVWRTTIWEIHPIMKIEVLNVPSWSK